MNKRIYFFAAFLVFAPMMPAFAQTEELDPVKSEMGHEEVRRPVVDNRLKVFGRGLMNLITLPMEVPRTVLSERKKHPKGWMLIVLPRTLENVVVRGFSAAHDSFVSPFYLTNDESKRPLSRRFDLPDYPWQPQPVSASGKAGNEPDSKVARYGVRG